MGNLLFKDHEAKDQIPQEVFSQPAVDPHPVSHSTVLDVYKPLTS